MARNVARFGLHGALACLLAAGVCAQTNAPAGKRDAFPLAQSTAPLDQAAIDEAIAVARASDVDTTVSAALLYHGLMLSQEDRKSVV